MAGRPPLAIGTYGKVRFSATATGWRARTQFRDYDGRTRDIERTGKTKGAAERKLKDDTRMWTGAAAGEITAETKVRELADIWIATVKDAVSEGTRAPGTLDNYRSMLKSHVLPALGELRLREVTGARLDPFFSTLKRKTGPAHARTGRAVVAGLLRYALVRGAISTNPVREVSPIESGRRKKARALTYEERRTWLAQLEADEKAVRHDLPDMSRFMMATGVRIGKALALLWNQVDSEANSVEITHTVVRIRGEGLRRRPTKTAAGERALLVPSWAVDMLRRRHEEAQADGAGDDGPVFPDSLGGLRDPSNVRRAFRDARGNEGFEWVTSHVFRKTAATVLDGAGLSSREIADHLGHARPSITQDVYMGRGEKNPAAAAALEDAVREGSASFSGD